MSTSVIPAEPQLASYRFEPLVQIATTLFAYTIALLSTIANNFSAGLFAATYEHITHPLLGHSPAYIANKGIEAGTSSAAVLDSFLMLPEAGITTDLALYHPAGDEDDEFGSESTGSGWSGTFFDKKIWEKFDEYVAWILASYVAERNARAELRVGGDVVEENGEVDEEEVEEDEEDTNEDHDEEDDYVIINDDMFDDDEHEDEQAPPKHDNTSNQGVGASMALLELHDAKFKEIIAQHKGSLTRETPRMQIKRKVAQLRHVVINKASPITEAEYNRLVAASYVSCLSQSASSKGFISPSSVSSNSSKPPHSAASTVSVPTGCISRNASISPSLGSSDVSKRLQSASTNTSISSSTVFSNTSSPPGSTSSNAFSQLSSAPSNGSNPPSSNTRKASKRPHSASSNTSNPPSSNGPIPLSSASWGNASLPPSSTSSNASTHHGTSTSAVPCTSTSRAPIQATSPTSSTVPSTSLMNEPPTGTIPSTNIRPKEQEQPEERPSTSSYHHPESTTSTPLTQEPQDTTPPEQPTPTAPTSSLNHNPEPTPSPTPSTPRIKPQELQTLHPQLVTTTPLNLNRNSQNPQITPNQTNPPTTKLTVEEREDLLDLKTTLNLLLNQTAMRIDKNPKYAEHAALALQHAAATVTSLAAAPRMPRSPPRQQQQLPKNFKSVGFNPMVTRIETKGWVWVGVGDYGGRGGWGGGDIYFLSGFCGV
ncbi:uncharacterized protein BO97DRAFT_453963 [Aspergillus homomorphus CBS 101889]|uniref:Uncharacterized protein n=1 Tax=Aspergillus homomorphus (strain CBS 101889) TaxID=1450537 RepID=A0A395HUE9_ASPHC|nr:hypothetical protein BO97DRAFT_453963 [Aspergillus homomorphus CBS 101889]RAL11447.1 hypothetical protein BO97DRAFT_453963 [Aspergillus homomorphus CBS 101889]